MVLILFGNGVVAMVLLFGQGVPGEVVKGGYTNITLAWGLAVTMGIYIAGKISGAHLNPAVTIALAAFRGFPWRKVIPYSIAQIAGAFVAAALVFWNYHPAFLRADPQLDHTAGVFTTFPAFPDIMSAGLLDQTIGTALLLLMIFAITDERNQPPANLGPILVGLVVVVIGMSFGGRPGPARLRRRSSQRSLTSSLWKRGAHAAITFSAASSASLSQAKSRFWSFASALSIASRSFTRCLSSVASFSL
jgi:glycerol uptake facilitator protein